MYFISEGMEPMWPPEFKWNCMIFITILSFHEKAHLHQNVSSSQWPPEQIPNGNTADIVYIWEIKSNHHPLEFFPGILHVGADGEIWGKLEHGWKEASSYIIYILYIIYIIYIYFIYIFYIYILYI